LQFLRKTEINTIRVVTDFRNSRTQLIVET
jgi:hypothetical protein